MSQLAVSLVCKFNMEHECDCASSLLFHPKWTWRGGLGPGQNREVNKLAAGIFLYLLTTRGAQVTDRMFAAGAQRLADYVTQEEIDSGMLYPNLSDLRDISLKVYFFTRAWIPFAVFACKPPPCKTNLNAIVSCCITVVPTHSLFVKHILCAACAAGHILAGHCVGVSPISSDDHSLSACNVGGEASLATM